MEITFDIAHERDLSQWMVARLRADAARIRLALFESQDPIIPRDEPLIAVLALEVVASQARARGAHPNLCLAVVAKALGLTLQRGEQGQPVLRGESGPDAFLQRVREETKVGVADGVSTTTEPPAPPAVTGANGTKIRIVRAGDVAGRVIQTLSDYGPLADAMRELGDEHTMELFERLSTEISKMITQGLQ